MNEGAEAYLSTEIESLTQGTNRRVPSRSQSIFKYVNLSTKTSWNYFESTLNDRKLIGGTYTALNDPFEMSPVFMDDITPRIRNTFKRPMTLTERTKGLSDEERFYSMEAKSADIRTQCGIAREYIDGVRQRGRVISFSDRFDSPLLWSHYANQYYGACLHFSGGFINPHALASQRARISYVNYSNQRPIYPLSLAYRLGNKEANGSEWSLLNLESEKMLFFTKAEDWAYENEIRIVYSTSNNTNITFEGQGLLSVILGPRMKADDRAHVMKIIAASRMPALPVREARVSTSSFSVTVDWDTNLNP